MLNVILRRPRSGRLEGWPHALPVAIHRDAAKRQLLRMRAGLELLRKQNAKWT
jgi:hypothetical protein